MTRILIISHFVYYTIMFIVLITQIIMMTNCLDYLTLLEVLIVLLKHHIFIINLTLTINPFHIILFFIIILLNNVIYILIIVSITLINWMTLINVTWSQYVLLIWFIVLINTFIDPLIIPSLFLFTLIHINHSLYTI